MAAYEDNKYVVLKMADLNAISQTNRNHLNPVLEAITRLRQKDGRDLNPRYFVCNQDEPYARDVINTILLGEEKKERSREPK